MKGNRQSIPKQEETENYCHQFLTSTDWEKTNEGLEEESLLSEVTVQQDMRS